MGQRLAGIAGTVESAEAGIAPKRKWQRNKDRPPAAVGQTGKQAARGRLRREKRAAPGPYEDERGGQTATFIHIAILTITVIQQIGNLLQESGKRSAR